jgi:uncharacterized protein (DUF305 family)
MFALSASLSTRLSMHAACLAAVVALAAGPSGARADAPAEHPATAVFEVRFMTDMIDHHSMAVAMGQMCIEKATHDELEALCDAIVTAQTGEIADMTSWLLDWYGVEHAYVMGRNEERMMQKMDAMEGGDFEIEWMQEMIAHHSTAIRHAGHCHHHAEHEELHQLCENIQATQAAEITQMHGWLCDWYSLCRP